jgi:hypothetical protein
MFIQARTCYKPSTASALAIPAKAGIHGITHATPTLACVTKGETA